MRNLLRILLLATLPAYLLLTTSTMAAQLIGRPVPVCNLTALDGAPVDSLQALKGEVLYVDFWASWCPPCIQSFPFLTGLQQEYGERGLRVIGVNLDEKIADAEKFLSDYPAGFTIVADLSKQCAKDFDVIAMPSSYLIDREGIVRYIHRGFRQGETKELRLIVEQLLDHYPD